MQDRYKEQESRRWRLVDYFVHGAYLIYNHYGKNNVEDKNNKHPNFEDK